MRKLLHIPSAICLLFVLSACGGVSAKDDAHSIMDSFLSAVQSSFDDAQNYIGGSCRTSTSGQTVGSCNGKQINTLFNSCTWNTSFPQTLSGSILNTFSDANCTTPLNVNDSLIRSIGSFKRSSSDGTDITSTTANQANYLGDMIGGGLTVKKTGPGTYSLSLDGITYEKHSGASTLYNHSVHSDIDLLLTGSYSDNSRSATGTAHVEHNLSKFQAKLTLTNVAWSDANCCFPVSGSIELEYLGAKTGTETLTFNSSCGNLNFVSGGDTTTYTLESCY